MIMTSRIHLAVKHLEGRRKSNVKALKNKKKALKRAFVCEGGAA